MKHDMQNMGRGFIGMSLFLLLSLAPLSAVEAPEVDPQNEAEANLTAQFYSEYVRAFLNNEYLLENIRLVALAAERYGQGRYAEAFDYAQEAIRYATLSDEYVAMHLRIRDADNAISSARFRLEWARRVGAPSRHAETYQRAQDTFADALAAREREEWDPAKDLALRVIDILADVTPTLPAQFVVRTWAGSRHCLWNIAALPEIYGDPTRWPILFQANRHRMPRPGDPDLIHPGMILDIPSIAGEVRYGIMMEEE